MERELDYQKEYHHLNVELTISMIQAGLDRNAAAARNIKWLFWIGAILTHFLFPAPLTWKTGLTEAAIIFVWGCGLWIPFKSRSWGTEDAEIYEAGYATKEKFLTWHLNSLLAGRSAESLTIIGKYLDRCRDSEACEIVKEAFSRKLENHS